MFSQLTAKLNTLPEFKLTKQNYKNFLYIEKVKNEKIEQPLETGMLKFKQEIYKQFNIDEVYSRIIRDYIKPMSDDTLKVKVSVDDLFISNDIGLINSNEDFLEKAKEILTAFKDIQIKFSEYVLFDNISTENLQKEIDNFKSVIAVFNLKS